MEKIHRLPDGSRLVVWEEWNQAKGLVLPVRRGTGPYVYRQDVLRDLTSVLYQGNVYYAYHSLDHRICLGTAGEREVTAVLSDPSDLRRYSRLELLSWQDELWLFFCAWDPAVKKWDLKVMRPLASRETVSLWEGFPELPDLDYAAGERLMILWQGNVCLWDGRGRPEKGEILMAGAGESAREAILSLKGELEEERKIREGERDRLKAETAERLSAVQEWYGDQMEKAKAQYEELAAYASALQDEGKKWREKYYKARQEAGRRQPTVR